MHLNFKSQHKSKHLNKDGLERLPFTRLLIVFGVLFLMSGIYLFFSTSPLVDSVYNFILDWLKPGTGVDIEKIHYSSVNGLNPLFYYYIPALSLLVILIFYRVKYQQATYMVALITMVYLIMLQIKLLVNSLMQSYYYESLSMAVFFIIFCTILMLVLVYKLKTNTSAIITCIYFYISVVSYTMSFGWYSTLFVLVFLFIITIIWIGIRIQRPYINAINFVFCIGFFALFFLRKFVFNSKISYSSDFLIFGSLYYILFYTIPLWNSNSVTIKISQRIQIVLVSSNFIFYLLSTSFVLYKFYNYIYICIFVTILLLISVCSIFFIKKYAKNVWLFPYEYLVIFLSALILPVWFQDSKILLFAGVFSLIMLVYSIKRKLTSSFWIGIASLLIAVISYITCLIMDFIPILMNVQKIIRLDFLIKGIINSAFLLSVLWGIRYFVKDEVLPVSEDKLKSRKLRKIIDVFLLSALFIAVGLIIFIIPYFVSGSAKYLGLSWFISGSLFFIYFIRYFTGKKMALKKPTQYAAYLFSLLYPLLTTIGLLNISQLKVVSCDWMAIVLHLISLFLFVILSYMAIQRIIKRNKTNLFALRIISLQVVIYLLFILFTEYNNITMLLACATQQFGALEPDSIFITSNFFFPFSIILALFATLVNIYAIVKQDGFLRIVSVVLIVLAVAKLFILDKSTVTENALGTIFILSGVFLVVLAFLNSWLVNRISRGGRTK